MAAKHGTTRRRRPRRRQHVQAAPRTLRLRDERQDVRPRSARRIAARQGRARGRARRHRAVRAEAAAVRRRSPAISRSRPSSMTAQIAVRGKWTGTPGGTLGQLTSVCRAASRCAPAPRASSRSISRKLLGGLPPVPLAGGVTFDDAREVAQGPDPRGDPERLGRHPGPRPASRILRPAQGRRRALQRSARCCSTSSTRSRPARAGSGCTSASVLELEAWVDANELRIGAHKDAPDEGHRGRADPDRARARERQLDRDVLGARHDAEPFGHRSRPRPTCRRRPPARSTRSRSSTSSAPASRSTRTASRCAACSAPRGPTRRRSSRS